MAQFAVETGLSVGLLKDCHRTARVWPAGTRIPGITHSKHSTYAARPDRVNLLLNDDMDDGLSGRVRERVKKAEELLADQPTRAAFIERSRTRRTRIAAAARAIEDEDVTKARTEHRIREQDAKARLAAPEILSKMAERAIRGNVALARMVAELLDLRSVIDQVPAQYHVRTIENLTQIQGAAQQVLDKLRPVSRSPQPLNFIDMQVDDRAGAEHR